MAVPGCAGVWVATDDQRIADEVTAFGGQVIMTSPDCVNGTERCADALARLGDVAPMIVNLQGDAPLSPSELIPLLVERLGRDCEAAMATPAVRCSQAVLSHLRSDEAAGRVGGTTAVFSASGRALYFSKRILPYRPAPSAQPGEGAPVYLHLGLYAYRAEALSRYLDWAPKAYEVSEGLEQLRFLDNDQRVSVLPVEQLDWDPIELNNPSDVPIIEQVLTGRGIA